MHSRRWMMWVALGLVCVVSMTGCKKKTGGRTGLGSDEVIGIGGHDIYGTELSDRFSSGMEIEGQFSPVYFDYDKSQIRDSERARIEEVANHLRRNPATRLIIDGHCDERGSNEYNLALGERRALAVRAYLIGLGIDGSRVQTRSYGEERPVAFGTDESAWRLNRRGEFVLVQ